MTYKKIDFWGNILESFQELLSHTMSKYLFFKHLPV